MARLVATYIKDSHLCDLRHNEVLATAADNQSALQSGLVELFSRINRAGKDSLIVLGENLEVCCDEAATTVYWL